MHKTFRTRRAAAVAAAAATAAVAALAVTRPAFAANWNGSAGDGLWETPGNWDGNTVPGSNNGAAGTSTDNAQFRNGPASTTTTVAVDLNRNIGSLNFTSDTTSFRIGPGTANTNTGSTLFISNGGGAAALTTVAGINADFSAPLGIIGTVTFTNDSVGGLRSLGTISAANPGISTLTLNGSHGTQASSQAEIDGPVTDAAGVMSIVKQGTGTWELNAGDTAPNTYSGDTIINAGILRCSTATGYNGLGGFSPNSHYIVNNGGTLRNSVIGTTVKSITINFGGILNVSTAASTTLNIKCNSGPGLELNYTANTNSNDIALSLPINLTGTTADEGGITLLTSSGASGTGQVTLGASTSPFSLGPVRRVLDIGRGADGKDYDLRIQGVISGSAGFIKKGAGILRFNGPASPLTGTIEVQAGTFNPSAMNNLTGQPSLLLTGGDLLVQSGQTQTFGLVTVNKGNINGGNATSPGVVSAPGFNFLVASGDTASLGGSMTLADSSGGPSPLLKDGAGSATLSGILSYTGATTVNNGVLSLATSLTSSSSVSVTGGKLELRVTAAPDRVFKTPALSVTGSGKIDIKHNKLITASPVGSASGAIYSGVTGLIQSGRNGGGWGGNGIVTSMGDATGGNFTSIGVATAQQVKGLATAGDTAVWGGQTVTGSDALVMYTYGGDANLDGKINVDDYGRIDFNVPLGTNGWFNGDFNYDGKINVDDYGIIDFNIGIQGTTFPTAPSAGDSLGAVAPVPEPVTVSLISLGVSVLAARRRRGR